MVMKVFRCFVLTLLVCNSFVVFAQDPNPPLITRLSVDPVSEQVDIYWVNSSNQVVGYIIYFEDISGLWIPLDTVFGLTNTNFTTTNANPQNKIETFSVVAFDAMGNNSIRSSAHSTIFVNNSYEECDTSVFLDWNPYLNMVGMEAYQLKIIREDLTTGIVFPEVTIDIEKEDTSFFMPVDYSSIYTIWLEATSTASYVSKSNRVLFASTEIDVPTFSYVNRVTVEAENSIKVTSLSNSNDLSHVNIYRSYTADGFQFFTGKAELSSDEYSFVDDLVLPYRNLYYYRSKPVDICGKEYDLTVLSNLSDTSIVHNLKLDPQIINKESISVITGDYDGFIGTSHQEMWKDVNGQRTFLQNVYSNTTYDISIENDFGKVCIYSISTEDEVNDLGRKDTVFSNQVCISKSPILYIPKAFTPDNGDIKNDIWNIAINQSESIDSYKLQVFSRWGQLMFESNSLEEGWDGTFANNYAPNGMYIFDIQIQFAQGQNLRETGRIVLLR